MDALKKKKLIFLSFLTILQLFFYLKTYSIDNEENVILIQEQKEYITLKNTYEDLPKGGNLQVMDICKDTNGWKINIKISGDKDEIADTLNELNNYKIDNYKIHGESDIFIVQMEIIR